MLQFAPILLICSDFWPKISSEFRVFARIMSPAPCLYITGQSKSAKITPETECGTGHSHFCVFSFVRHPVDTNLAYKRGTEKIFYTKIIRI